VIISREDAQTQGLKRYFTGEPCKHGHVVERYVSCYLCVECQREKVLRNRIENPERWKAYKDTYREKNRDALIERSRQWRQKNPTKKRAVELSWRQRNRHKIRAHKARRRLEKLDRIPRWADKDKIEEFYAAARKLSEATGNEYHVDHIIPLRGKTVCGLHVETNLQILEGGYNRVKSNRHDPA